MQHQIRLRWCHGPVCWHMQGMHVAAAFVSQGSMPLPLLCCKRVLLWAYGDRCWLAPKFKSCFSHQEVWPGRWQKHVGSGLLGLRDGDRMSS